MAEFGKFFGFLLPGNRKKKEDQALGAKRQLPDSFALPQNDDGAITIQMGGGAFAYGTYLDFEGRFTNEIDLINRYRDMSTHAEAEAAIEDIVNQAIITDEDTQPVQIQLKNMDQSESVKTKIQEAFDEVCRLLDIENKCHDIFYRWYVDGRLYYHLMIDKNSPKKGIQEVRQIDPRRIRKLREVIKERDPVASVERIREIREWYVYNEGGIKSSVAAYTNTAHTIKIAPDSIVYVPSGLMDQKTQIVLSYLHKAMKPHNQLRMVEDSQVIYRLSRAPERRIFYIDVGNLPKIKAEQYMKDIMNKYRNKLVYDANTGEIRDDRRIMSMQEDFWLPRREGGKGTEITTLPGGQNLSEIDDITYFQKKFYKSLHVPVSRLEPDTLFQIGRASEITRDELKFFKFIERLRAKFTELFNQLLRAQLILTGVISEDDWDDIKEQIHYEFQKDSYFQELKEAEILRERVAILRDVNEYAGKYYSHTWIRKNVLKQSDDEIEQIDKEMEEEKKDEKYQQDDDQFGGGGGGGFGGNNDDENKKEDSEQEQGPDKFGDEEGEEGGQKDREEDEEKEREKEEREAERKERVKQDKDEKDKEQEEKRKQRR